MARARSSRGGSGATSDIWPGFVDALSTLLMVVIFLLAVFVLAQFFLGQLLEGRDAAVGRLEQEVDDLSQALELERETSLDLRQSLSRLSSDLDGLLAERDELAAELGDARDAREEMSQRVALLSSEQAQLQQTLEAMRLERDSGVAELEAVREELAQANETIATDRESMAVQMSQLVQLRRDIEALRTVRAELETKVAELGLAVESEKASNSELAGQLAAERDRSAVLEARLAEAGERTSLAQREIAERETRIEELLRSAATLKGEVEEKDAARAAAMQRVTELTRQINALSVQLTQLDQILGLRKKQIEDQARQISDLGARLNLALASQVEELTQFRSDFFGRLRRVLGDRKDVEIVGDRFVFQSEVLFESGEAEIRDDGRRQIAELAATLKEIAAEIPSELPWVLQVDGHTDRRPISTSRFPSNWELSTARAISVAQVLIDQGIPPERVAARGFAEFQPLDPADSEAAYRRNRRIEIKLTTR